MPLLTAARRRPTLTAALAYSVLAVLMVAQGLLPGRTLSSADYLWTPAPWSGLTPDGVRLYGANGELADAVAVFQPFLEHARERLPDVPLWNPHVMAGRPFLANAQSAVFSPFSLPGYVLPVATALAVIAALKLLVAALGTFVLARALGMRPAAAFLAGLAFGFGLYMVTWLAWPLTGVWALLPWLLVAVEAVVRRPGVPQAAALALVVGVQFLCGHPESSFHIVAVATLFAALRLSRRPGGRARRAAVLAGGATLGGLLAALVLVPFLELLWHSADLDDRGSRDPVHIPRKYVLGVALPEYWGRPTQSTTEPFVNVRAYYCGALALLLGACALLRPSRERVAVALTGAVAMAVVLGIRPVFTVVTALPGFAQAANTRLGIVVTLALALLAGWGLDDLLARRGPGRRATAAVAGVVVLVPLLVVALRAPLEGRYADDALAVAFGLRDLPATAANLSVAPMAAAFLWLAPAGAGALLLVRAGRLAPGTLAALAIALVAADLFRFGVGQNPAIPRDHARQPATAGIRALQARGAERFAGVLPQFGIVPLPADVGMRYGLFDARGYDYPVERRYDQLWRAAIAPPVPFAPPTTLAASTPRALRALGLLGTTHLLQQPGDDPLDSPDLRVVRDGPDLRIYANRRALPRAWLVEGQQVVAGGDDATLRAVLDPAFDARRAAVVGHALAGLPARPATAPSSGTARIARYEPERVELAVRAPRPALVVLSDLAFPGWRARVDGHDARIERVDHLLRAVAVPAGAHSVEMTYRPLSWRAGWIVSLTTALGLLAALLWDDRRRRRA